MHQPKNNLELIDAGPWMASLAGGRHAAVIRGARDLRAEGCIGAFHLELLAQVAQRTPEGIAAAGRLVDTLLMRDLYQRMQQLLDAGRSRWLEAASWYLHRELGKPHTVSCGERLESLILAELGLAAKGISSEEAAAFEALALIQKGELESAFDVLFEAATASSDSSKPETGQLFRRAGHTLFMATPRDRKHDVLTYRRGLPPTSYGIAPFPGRGFLIKEYLGRGKPLVPLLAREPSMLSPVETRPWVEGWTPSHGMPQNDDSLARVDTLLRQFSHGKKRA